MVWLDEGEEGRPEDGGEVDGSTLDAISPTLVHIPPSAGPTEKPGVQYACISARTKPILIRKTTTGQSSIELFIRAPLLSQKLIL